MNKDFWTKIYEQGRVTTEPSTFAKFAAPFLVGKETVELGCGNGRDLYWLREQGVPAFGVDSANEDLFIIKQDVAKFIAQNDSPECVYTRFFWHAIERPLQQEILHWAKKRILIEARTTKDKPENVVGKHSRTLVDVKRLYRDLAQHGFTVLSAQEGYGLSIYKGEDPHLIRVIAEKS